MTTDRKTGKVKFFDSKRGFGFIKPDDGSRDIFISINRLSKEFRGLMPDQRCSFIVADDTNKGPYAKDFALL